MDVFQTSDKGYPNALIQNPNENPDLSFQPDVPDGVPANSDLETRLYGDNANRKTIEPEPRRIGTCCNTFTSNAKIFQSSNFQRNRQRI